MPLVPDELNLNIGIQELSILNDYSVEIRYPGLEEPLTREEAEAAVSIADKVSSLIQMKINSLKQQEQ